MHRDSLKTMVNPNGLNAFCPNCATRVSFPTKTHIAYLIAGFETNRIENCCDAPYRTDHFASLLLTNLKSGKNESKKKFTFNTRTIENWSTYRRKIKLGFETTV